MILLRYSPVGDVIFVVSSSLNSKIFLESRFLGYIVFRPDMIVAARLPTFPQELKSLSALSSSFLARPCIPSRTGIYKYPPSWFGSFLR